MLKKGHDLVMINCDWVMTGENEFATVVKDFREMQESFKDSVYLASLMHKISEERTASNLVLKEINAKLDRLATLEHRIARIEERMGPGREATALSEVDEEIVAFVKKSGVACAEDVRRALKYKGKNAASARLNALHRQGVLEKKRAGMKVFYALSH